MSNLSGLGGSAASYYANALQQLQQRLFSKIDANGDGTVSQSELETAVTKAGGTTKGADALYAALDPNNSGSVSKQQFAQNLPLPSFSPAMGAQLIADQAQMCAASAGATPASFSKQTLFTQLDANGDGSLTKSELEQAVTKAGGTVASADALYAKLDPSNTGSVSAQQFVQNLPGAHHHHHHGGGGATPSDALASDSTTSGTGTSTDSGNSAEDALMALVDSLVQQPTVASNPFDTSSQTATGSTGTTTSTSTDTAQAALDALLDNVGSPPPAASASTTNTSGNSADDALLALLNADGSNTNTATSAASTASSSTTATSQASTPATLFSKVSQQILAFMLQLQSQSFAG
jgi:Ca2+-binding EF-hand superfamily protein